MDIVNCRKFRLTVYKEHEATGFPPVRELSYVCYRSSDHGGIEWNHSLKIWLTTLHLKWRAFMKS